MDGWKTLKNEGLGRPAARPRLSIYKGGQVNWSKPVQEHLGNPERVELLLDREGGKLAIRPVAEGGFKVSGKVNFVVSATPALRCEGLLPGEAYRATPELTFMQGANIAMVDVSVLLNREELG